LGEPVLISHLIHGSELVIRIPFWVWKN